MAQAAETAKSLNRGAAETRTRALVWAGTALAIAAIGMAGSLYLSIGMGLKACPLCFYQRTFIMGVFAVLSVGLLVDRARAGFLCLLSLPLAMGGLGVAAFHEYLVLTSKLECPLGVFSMGTAPLQSFVAFVFLTVVVAFGAMAGKNGLPPIRIPVVAGATVLGSVLAWGSVASAPPLPPTPTKPYDAEKQPLDMCRPPFRSP